jgi:hypothetical protein
MHRITRGLMASMTLAGVVLAFTHVLATEALAQNPFDIDGDVPANGSPGGVDPTQVTDPFGNLQELGAANSNTTKVGNINTDVPPTLDFTNPNGQVDLRRIWTQTAKDLSSNDIWLYFAWERDASSGSGFIAFEFQQNALSASCVYTGTGIDFLKPASAAETALINSCNPWAGRKAGDFIILWDQSGSALNITKRVFNGSAFGPSVALGSAEVAISADGFRGEAAIDLTQDVFPPSGTCLSFANIVPGTVTGNSDNADYKDTVLSRFEPISNCGSVKVVKATVPAGETGSFPYTLQRQGNGDIKFDHTKQVNATLTSDGDFDTISDLITATDYTLAEGTLASPWELVSIVCDGTDVTGGGTFSVVASQTTTCTITNKRKRGSLTVIKHVINDNGGSAVAADFSISLGDNPTPTTFGGTESPGQTFTFDEGYAFAVAELSGPPGYTGSLSGDCSGTIVADTTKVCTVTNDDNPAHLIVIKHVINDNGGTKVASDFTMTINGLTASGGTSFPGAEAPGTNKTLTSVGSYNVTESSVSGYTSSFSTDCTGTIALGETKSCTVTNDDTKASPALDTDQRVVLHDKVTITGIRTGATNAGDARVTFRLYSDAACATLLGTEGPLTISMNGTTGTATTVIGILVDPVPPASQSNTYRWRAQYTGDDFNNGFTTACGDETTAVTFSPK